MLLLVFSLFSKKSKYFSFWWNILYFVIFWHFQYFRSFNLGKRETMTTENRDLTQVSLVFAHTSTHKDQRLSILFFFLFLGGKSGLITHNQNLYVNKKMGKNLFLQQQRNRFSRERFSGLWLCWCWAHIVHIFLGESIFKT